MSMIVMFIMGMLMAVLHQLVGVRVFVSLRQMQPDTDYHKGPGSR